MAVFYDRTNSAGGGAFYDRTNSAESDAGTLNLQTPNVTASGIAYQVVTAAAAITNETSAFYNLGYSVVNGATRVALPTQWQGSTITLSADGSFIIAPALPSGTTMPRRHFNSVAGQWEQDTITILNGNNTGFLQLPGFGVSGVGTLGASRGIRRTLVNKLGNPISQGTQIRAVVTDSLAPGYTTFFNGVVIVGAAGLLEISSDALPSIGQNVVLSLYSQGNTSSGDDDSGMAPRRVQIIALT